MSSKIDHVKKIDAWLKAKPNRVMLEGHAAREATGWPYQPGAPAIVVLMENDKPIYGMQAGSVRSAMAAIAQGLRA